MTGYPAALNAIDGSVAWEGSAPRNNQAVSATEWGIVLTNRDWLNTLDDFWVQRIWPEEGPRITVPDKSDGSIGRMLLLDHSEPRVVTRPSPGDAGWVFDVSGDKPQLVESPPTESTYRWVDPTLPVVRPASRWETIILSRNDKFAAYLERELSEQAGTRDKVRGPAHLMVYDVAKQDVAYTRELDSIVGLDPDTPIVQAVRDLDGVGTPEGKPIEIGKWGTIRKQGWFDSVGSGWLAVPLDDGRIFIQGAGVLVGESPGDDTAVPLPENSLGFVFARNAYRHQVLALQAAAPPDHSMWGDYINDMGPPELYYDSHSGRLYSNPAATAERVVFSRSGEYLGVYDSVSQSFSVWRLAP